MTSCWLEVETVYKSGRNKIRVLAAARRKAGFSNSSGTCAVSARSRTTSVADGPMHQHAFTSCLLHVFKKSPSTRSSAIGGGYSSSSSSLQKGKLTNPGPRSTSGLPSKTSPASGAPPRASARDVSNSSAADSVSFRGAKGSVSSNQATFRRAPGPRYASSTSSGSRMRLPSAPKSCKYFRVEALFSTSPETRTTQKPFSKRHLVTSPPMASTSLRPANSASKVKANSPLSSGRLICSRPTM
mmetsp:Transcript_58057/g.135784  ORF Transcript_58057/g.135784 Transcript_58057/m.135784 type:complete len:242 (+) Transcript_58057:648-1373(+)